jgi:thiamine biosynthesis protein ThiS
MELKINGELKEFPAPLSLQELIQTLKLASDRVAVELNGRVIPRREWLCTQLTNNDRIEIVHFVGGGYFPGWTRRRTSVEFS